MNKDTIASMAAVIYAGMNKGIDDSISDAKEIYKRVYSSEEMCKKYTLYESDKIDTQDWESKSPSQILVSVNDFLKSNYTQEILTNEKSHITLRIPYPVWSMLTQPMRVCGVPVTQATLNYIEKYNVTAAKGVKAVLEPALGPALVK